MEEQHLYTSDQKIEWWGYGEWVEEPDAVLFEYEGFQCQVIREAYQVIREAYYKKFHMFGGYLCGYILVPKEHPYLKQKEIHVSVFRGIKSFGLVNDGNYLLEFDCFQSNDICPSIEFSKKSQTEPMELKSKLPSSNIPFEKEYRNISFCINQCRYIVDQMLKIKNEYVPSKE